MKIALCVILGALFALSAYAVARDFGVPLPMLTHYLRAETGLYDRRAWMKWSLAPRWAKRAALVIQNTSPTPSQYAIRYVKVARGGGPYGSKP